MLININKKRFLFISFALICAALSAQKTDSLSYDEKIGNQDTSSKWLSVSFGLNIGYTRSKSTIIKLYGGSYDVKSTPSIGLSIKLNVGERLTIGTGITRNNVELSSIDPILINFDSPSTTATEPDFLITSKGSVNVNFNVLEIPFELTYKFNKIKKHYIPTFSFGLTYSHYFATYLRPKFQYLTYEPRPSNSKPRTEFINSHNFSFTNKRHSTPFISLGFIRPLSDHSFIKLNAKLASNQNTANTVLRFNTQADLMQSSRIDILQFGLFAEYFIIF
jgi:hypothetical protein